MSDTLIIDRSGMPISFVNWQRAVSLVYTGKAHALYEDDSAILKSSCFEVNMPRVIQLKNEVKKRMFKNHVPFSRRNIAIRDNSKCQYCDQVLATHQYTFDHVHPRSKGGQSTWENLVLACLNCNKKKADKTLSQANLTLLRKPTEPKANDKRFNFKLRINTLRPEWEPWSAWIYWNIVLDK
jgi:5-methylcytosine-specific restriction endonuclease McrA